jgi:methyl-accepting chemotaxis protein
MSLTIGRKIALLVVLPVLALSFLAFTGLRGVDRVNRHLEEINRDLVPSLQLIAVMQRDFGVMHAVLYRHILTPDPAKKPEVEKRIVDMRKGVGETLEKYEKSFASTQAEKSETAKARTALAAYNEMADRVMKLSQGGDVPGAQAIMDKEATPKRSAVHNAMTTLFDINASEATERATSSNQEYRSVTIQTFVIGGLMVALVAVAGFLIGRSITAPIGRMQASMTNTAASLDFTQRIGLRTGDEIGLAVQAYEGLLERLQASLREIKNGIDSVHRASGNMATNADGISSSSQAQSESASAMAASIEEMTVSVNHIADRAGDARDRAASAGTAAAEGARVIYATVEKMTAIAGTVESSAAQMKDLKALSDSISSVVTVIKEVADQTNLLALNAAIEAARAGEQGRGFAVVADEVRKLAERTAKSTQEIATLLGRVQSATEAASTRMQAAVGEVGAGVETAQAAGQAIAQIQQGTEAIVGMVNEISDAVREQSAASTHLAQQIERIAQAAEENSAAATQTAQGAHDLDGMAQSIRTAVDAYRV